MLPRKDDFLWKKAKTTDLTAQMALEGGSSQGTDAANRSIVPSSSSTPIV